MVARRSARTAPRLLKIGRLRRGMQVAGGRALSPAIACKPGARRPALAAPARPPARGDLRGKLTTPPTARPASPSGARHLARSAGGRLPLRHPHLRRRANRPACRSRRCTGPEGSARCPACPDIGVAPPCHAGTLSLFQRPVHHRLGRRRADPRQRFLIIGGVFFCECIFSRCSQRKRDLVHRHACPRQSLLDRLTREEGIRSHHNVYPRAISASTSAAQSAAVS
jgi:hypothetical protein